ncbi:MAG: hypothetical protein HOI23_12000 [Deltaproteobacteria bacterium]|jgi:hypothetical protein|nr:hypothetical protein [Deltaproteobacteria bacterium]MBT6433148.1 hypothetical protein [Deltaproteobacteria bacterium]MBT6491845.1 hypothetical protein [Deltaproteobacteria bacterium]
MRDESTNDQKAQQIVGSDSQNDTREEESGKLAEIAGEQETKPGGLMVFFVTSSQTRLPSRYRRRRRRASTRLAHMRRRELSYTGPNSNDIGR